MNAINQMIPQQEWPRYFDGLNRLYQGWSIAIEVLGQDLGDQPATEGLSIRAFSVETKGSAAGNILIDIGDFAQIAMIHQIRDPRTLYAADLQPGLETDIQIESQDGTRTLLRLRRRPELPSRIS